MSRNWLLALTISVLFAPLEAASARLEHFAPVVFEVEPNVRYASTDMKRWEIFTRDGVQLSSALSLEFVGADRRMKLEGQGTSSAKLGLYYGDDASKWKPECRSVESVAYIGLYPGIDLIYHRLEGRLKGDFIVHPGVDPGVIRFRFKGAEVSGDEEHVVIHASNETLEERIPAVYQSGSAGPVKAHYRRYADGTIGFDLSGRAHDSQLTIDPDLTFSSFLAGSMLDQVTATVYSSVESMLLVTGWTESGDLLGISSTFKGSLDGYYGRFTLSPTGAVSLSSITLFGGTGSDKPLAIAVSRSGKVAIGGTTTSSNFPTLVPYQSKLKGTSDGFILRFSPFTTAFTMATYVGGSGVDQVNGVAIDTNNTVYFAGTTSSKDLAAIPGAPQLAYGGGATDGFAGLLNSSSSMGYLTYLGGSGTDSIAGLSMLNGEVYITGATDSWDYPTRNAYQNNSAGGQDVFITKLNGAGQLAYSSYLGGTSGYGGSPEMGVAIAVNTLGEAYVTGMTSSTNFPVLNATQGLPNFTYGITDSFLAKFTSSGGLAFSTYWGGSSWDQSNAIVILPSGYVAIGGTTSSLDFPVAYPIGAGPGGSPVYDGSRYGGAYDGFVSVFSPAGVPYWSTYLGGLGSDSVAALAVNPTGEVFVAGSTGSHNFPLLNALQVNISATGYHGFLAKIGLAKPQLGIFNASRCEFDLVNNADFIPLTNSNKFTAFFWSNVCPAGATNDEVIPVVGDWDNTGRQRLGLFRRSTGNWYLDINGDNLFDTSVDLIIPNFGAGAYPVVGDWDNTGRTRLGYYGDKPGGIASLWFLDMNGDRQFRYSDDKVVSFGVAGATPIVGDWTNSGKQRIGIFYMSLWYLDLVGDMVDRGSLTTAFGFSVDLPVFFNWDNSSLGKRIGVYHPIYLPSWWSVDTNGNRAIDPTDLYYLFGLYGVVPVVGVQSH